jgi:antitoxin VapB
MGEQLNIKDAQTIELARDLAKQLGKTVTATIREALEEKAQICSGKRETRIEAMLAVAKEFREGMPAEWHGKTSKEIMDEIYDEHGLPK